MKKKHFNIPIFVPELACPFRCIYCNQREITGKWSVPDSEEINNILYTHLSTIHEKTAEVELAFFGGNFTGLPVQDQISFLTIVQPYIASGRISGIRISTRPDYIQPEILAILKDHHVTTIELGAQSMDDDILRWSARGYTAEVTEKASALILGQGFRLGLQMMIGLPGDTMEKSLQTAKHIVRLGASETRIYPTVVISGTGLEAMYLNGQYTPLSLQEAVGWSKKLLLFFETSGVNVIRIGLHPSEGLLSGNNLVAGAFHPSFRELVLTEIWSDLLSPLTVTSGDEIILHVPQSQINYAIGYSGKNRKMLRKSFGKVRFYPDRNLKETARESRAEIIHY